MNVTPHVSDYMDKSFITISPDMDIYEAIDTLLKKKITSAAVVDEKEKLIGILAEKDCLKVLAQAETKKLVEGKVGDFMTRDVVTINPNLDVFSVASLFLKQYFRRFLVVKEGKLVGQITRRDLLKAIRTIKLS